MKYISVYASSYDYENGDVSYTTVVHSAHSAHGLNTMIFNTVASGAVVEVVDEEYTGVCQVYSNSGVKERKISMSEWDDIVNG